MEVSAFAVLIMTGLAAGVCAPQHTCRLGHAGGVFDGAFAIALRARARRRFLAACLARRLTFLMRFAWAADLCRARSVGAVIVGAPPRYSSL